ncbi:hypothetical protein V8F20_008952 [Naviculisporaceae sp. PSN 640]
MRSCDVMNSILFCDTFFFCVYYFLNFTFSRLPFFLSQVLASLFFFLFFFYLLV